LLYFSSGGSLYSDSHTPLAESGEVHPRSYHGAGKLAAEAFISAWCAQFGEGAVALRPSNVYGPGQPERPGFGIIPTAFGKILRGETLSIWGDGQAQRDYVFIDDLVKLCLEILSRPFGKGLQPINCASGQSVSLNALLEMMEGVSGRPLLRHYDRSRALDASCIAMDPTLANRLYGWSAGVGLESGLTRTWECFVNDAR
jgi:UDP-glucose 4-epimerase